MKNKKLLKMIAATIACSAMGISAFSFTACNPDNSDNDGDTNGGHKHSYTWVDDENGTTHHEHCGVDGCDAPDKAPVDHVDGNNDNTCDDCGATLPIPGPEYDIITTSVDFKAAANEIAGATTSANQTVGTGGYTYGGKFFFADGNRFEPGSSCVNTQKKDVTITVGGVTNSIKIVGKGASGTAGDIVLKNSSGTVIDTATSTGNGVAIALSGTDLPAGVYTITSGTSVRLTEITITEKLEKAEATGITVTASKVDFLVNEGFSDSGLTVTLNYANGRKDTLASTAYKVTQSVDKTKAGKYTVTVKYKENEQFTDTYDVYYYTIDSIEQSTIGYDGSKQVMLQQAVKTGSTLSSNYLTVKGTGTVEGRTHSFNLPASALNVQLPATTTEGEVTVNYSVDTSCTTDGKTLGGSYKVMVKNAISAVNNKVEVTVGETGDFKTLTQAVQFLKACSIAEEVNKVIKLQAGTYTEKVWIDMPNVTLIGLGENIDDTKLTYSLVEGDTDLYSGSLWGLNCATLHVTGKNFKAYNLAIHNDFDYINNVDKYSGSQAAQGVALTLAGDGNVIYNCHLYGNQDTLYMKDSRSYFYKTQIDGNVDFIFGNNKGLAYFDECKIVAINRGKSENGHVAVPQHDDNTKPDYGYIFDNCEFTDDGAVAAGGMTLGRPWGKKATVAYINCSFSAAYAQKFVDMSGNTPGNADFRVYNATDASGNPITGTPVGGSLLTETEVVNYTKANMFGTSNGKSGYTTAFDWSAAFTNLKILAGLEEGDITEDPTVEITFVLDSIPEETVGTYYADKLEWSGTGRWNKDNNVPTKTNSIQVSTDTVITMKVAGRVSVSWFSGQGSNGDISITYDENGCATITVIKATGKYMTGLTVDTSDIPAQTQKVSVTVDYNDEGATENGTLEAIVGSPLTKPADPVRAGYTFIGWKVNGADYDFTENVTEAFTLVAQWQAGEKEYQTITSSTSATDAKIQRNDGKLTGTDYFNVEGTWGENGGHPLFTEDCKISFYVTAGAHIDMETLYSGNGTYTIKASAEGKDVASLVKTPDSDHVVFDVEDILSDLNGVERILIEITAEGTAYCQSLTVTYPTV